MSWRTQLSFSDWSEFQKLFDEQFPIFGRIMAMDTRPSPDRSVTRYTMETNTSLQLIVNSKFDVDELRNALTQHFQKFDGRCNFVSWRQDWTSMRVFCTVQVDVDLHRWKEALIPARALFEPGTCPKCGDRGQWISLALACRNGHGVFAG